MDTKNKRVSFAEFPTRPVIYKTALEEGLFVDSIDIGGIFQVLSIEFSTANKIVTARLSVS